MEFLQATSKFRVFGSGSKTSSQRQFRGALQLILLVSLFCIPSYAGWRTRHLQSSTTAVNFGSALVGTSTKQVVTYTCMSSSRATIYGINASGGGFSFTGPSLPLTLSQGQSASFSVAFAPTAAGNIAGSASVISTATDSPLAISLSGNGSQSTHSVALTWVASPSNVVGYYVYSGTQAGGTLSKLNSTPVSGTAYTETGVLSGLTYYYAVTAADSSGVESAFSNETSIAIP